MKRFAIVTTSLYFLALAVLTAPVLWAAFGIVGKETRPDSYVAIFQAPQYWIWVAVMVASQLALLVVPVRVASRRPVAQRSLLWPVIVGGLMLAGLVAGGLASILEFIMKGEWVDGAGGWAVIAIGPLTWLTWSIIFYRANRQNDPSDVVSRVCRWMFRGSILELLVAIPTHIVARHRDYCCAGFGTFIGLTMGFSVMLISYGPAVLFLFVNRWKKLHPTAGVEKP